MLLLQRIARKDLPSKKAVGLDTYFLFEYMGKAEYEFGTLPRAVKRLRGSLGGKKGVPKEVQVVNVGLNRSSLFHQLRGAKKNLQGIEIFCIGDKDGLTLATKVFEDQFNNKNPAFKHKGAGSDWIQRAYGIDPFWADTKHPCKTIGWFNVGEEVPWAVFKEREDAELFLKNLISPEGNP